MTVQRRSADVVIVGAGISGWMLAALLGNRAGSVAVLDQRYQRPRDGSLAGVVTLSDFDALGLGRPPSDRLLPLETVVTFDLEDTAAPPPQTVMGAFVVQHDELLAWLRSESVGAGVIFEPDATVRDFQWSDGAVGGVIAGPQLTPWDARVVVLADESDPRLAEVLDLRPDWLPTQLMHIAKQRFDRPKHAKPATNGARPAAVFRGMTSWGQTGFGTLTHHGAISTLTVAMLLEDEMTSARHIRDFMDEVSMHTVIARAIRDFDPAAFVTEVIPIGGVADPHRLSGDGVLVLGDVVGLTHPLNRDGLSTNVDVAKLAAETIIDAARAGDFSSIALSRFDERVLDRVVEPLRRRAEARSLSADAAWTVSSRFQPLADLGQAYAGADSGAPSMSRTGQRPVSLRERLKGLGQRIRDVP